MAREGYEYCIADRTSGNGLQHKNDKKRFSSFTYNVPHPTLAHMQESLKHGMKVDADAVLVLTLHDELVYEVREECLPVVAHIARLCFEKSVIIGSGGQVPLQATIRVGGNLASLKEYRPC